MLGADYGELRGRDVRGGDAPDVVLLASSLSGGGGLALAGLAPLGFGLRVPPAAGLVCWEAVVAAEQQAQARVREAQR